MTEAAEKISIAYDVISRAISPFAICQITSANFGQHGHLYILMGI